MSHCQDSNKEDLFRMLRRSNENEFEESVKKDWYRARSYVLQVLDSKDVFYRMIKEQKRVHVVLEGTSPLIMSVARQIALLVHYPTFDDATGCNRTIITILFDKTKVSQYSILDFVSQEEYLCNLSRYCKCTIGNFEEDGIKEVSNENSFLAFLDIELELIGFDGSDFSKYKSSDSLRINDACILDKDFDETIDRSMARRVNMVYNVGMDFDNLPTDDPNTAVRYDRALQYFCYQQSPEDTLKKWNEMGNSVIDVKNKLSNVFCADCFPSRLIYVINKSKDKEERDIGSKNLGEYLKSEYPKVVAMVKDNLKSLAKCEHARWNVEKLLMGFRPLSEEEHLEDEQFFGKDRTANRKSLRKKSIHIDLCSYLDLRRINPGDMKYDCFLMIAMPRIMVEKLGKKQFKFIV